MVATGARAEMEIAYRALTETCILLLDANGVCRSVLAATASHQGRVARVPVSAERCIGAQFVATLDLRDPTGLTHMPEPGAPMLFARIEDDGRITLVRSAKVISFETVAGIDSGVRERPEVSYGDDDELTIPIELDELTVPRVSAHTPSGTKAARVPSRVAPQVPAYPTAPYPAEYIPAAAPRPSPRSSAAPPHAPSSPPPRASSLPPRPWSAPVPRPSASPHERERARIEAWERDRARDHERAAAHAERASSYPPPRTSGKVPILRDSFGESDAPRVTIPPPAPLPSNRRAGVTIVPQAPSPPRRPSLVRVPPPAYEGPTLPFRRTAR